MGLIFYWFYSMKCQNYLPYYSISASNLFLVYNWPTEKNTADNSCQLQHPKIKKDTNLTCLPSLHILTDGKKLWFSSYFHDWFKIDSFVSKINVYIHTIRNQSVSSTVYTWVLQLYSILVIACKYPNLFHC